MNKILLFVGKIIGMVIVYELTWIAVNAITDKLLKLWLERTSQL